MKLRAVFFDFDDTLGDRDIYAYRQYRTLIGPYLEQDDPFDTEAIMQDIMQWDQAGNVSKDYVQQMLAAKYGVKLPFASLDVQWGRLCYDQTERLPHAEKVLKELRASGYRLGCITNGGAAAQHSKLDSAGLAPLFDDIVVSGDIGVAKPDTGIFRTAMERLHVEPPESVMVGDIFSNDIIGAHRAGMHAIWMSRRPRMPMQALVPVIHAIEELPATLRKLEESL